MRTAKYLLAVDFHTGKRLWQTEPEEDPADTPSNHFNGRFVRQNMSQQSQYGQRIWDDATYGTLSSDGRLVFVIEELPLGVGGPNMGFIMFAGNGRNDASNRSITNKLAAYDIKTGKIQWWLGGQDALPMPEALRGAFFLGPPLPLRGQLYVMAEVKGEIRLFALDGATGKLLWQQQLTMVESKITEDPLRRLAGVSPSYSDGVLICPTGSGCVVAVDLATRSLLWGYIYSHTAETVPGIGMGMGVGMARRIRGNQIQMAFNNNSNGPMPRWLDGTATIVNGRVLLTPAEADSLYCLNLADGKPAWAPQPRGEHYYIASVHKGVIALVGRNSIDAVNLEDGGKAWGGRTINMPAGAGVCGHGCYAGGQYFLPLSSGEVMTVDLEAGKVLATAKPRCSAVPGNLVCYRGRVVSQGFDGLELYYQVDAARDDAARRLAVNPDDVEGLTLRGEMFLDAGKSTEAVADFRRAYSLVDKKSERAPGSRNEEEFCRVPGRGRTREMLRDALLAGLRDDFAAHRAMAGEVEPLLDDTAQRATFLRYMASGMDRAHDWRQAVEYYLKLVDLEETKPALEKIDRSYLVRRDCWVEARLGMLREAGGAEAAAQLDRALEQRLAEAKMDTGFDGLKRFLGFFGNQPQAAAARAELLGRATQGKRILEAELLMAAGVDSGDRKAQAALLADMALLNFGAGRVSDAAACFRHLQRQYADVPCHAGMTSSQWLAVFPGGDALRQEVDRPAPAWPLGEVQAGPPDTNQNPFNRGQHFDMQLGGCGGPFFSDSTVSCEANRQEISLRDGLGHVQKSVPLVENGRVFGGGYNPYSTLARSCGHLLVASVGTKICGLDPWKAGGNTSSVLWCHDLFENPNDNGGNVIFFNNGMADGRANSFGPVNARYVCYQRMRSLVAVDPLTGEQMWVRHDIPAHSEVFGDEQYVFVLSPDSSEVSAYSPFQPAFGVPRRSEAAPSSDNNEASVYRAIDGQLLGKRKIPRPKLAANAPFNAFRNFGRWGNSMLDDAGIDFLGRNVLTWESGANGRVLALFDPWRQQAVWPSRTFAAGARVSMVGNEAVGVLEPGGHFVMLALADGRTLADLKLDARPNFSVTDLIVARMGDQYIVLAHDGNVGNALQDQMMQMPQGMLCVPLRRARIYALDLQGKPAWPAPVDVDHQQFLLSQPGRLPVLVFAAYHFENRGGQMNNWRSSVVAVDRRNGRIVHEKDCGPMRGMGVEVSGDPTEKTVRIAFNNETVVLTFTDKPVKTTVRHSTGVKKPSGKLGEALLEAVQGAAGMQQ
jgi:outer membrane protein assembly factor BamB